MIPVEFRLPAYGRGALGEHLRKVHDVDPAGLSDEDLCLRHAEFHGGLDDLPWPKRDSSENEPIRWTKHLYAHREAVRQAKRTEAAARLVATLTPDDVLAVLKAADKPLDSGDLASRLAATLKGREPGVDVWLSDLPTEKAKRLADKLVSAGSVLREKGETWSRITPRGARRSWFYATPEVVAACLAAADDEVAWKRDVEGRIEKALDEVNLEWPDATTRSSVSTAPRRIALVTVDLDTFESLLALARKAAP